MLRLQNLMSKDFGVRSFVVAGAIIFVAVAIRLVLDGPLPHIPPFITLFPAVALAGLLCGPWAGGVAGLIGAAAADFLWIPPRLSFGPPSLTDGIAVALFIAGSTLLLAVTAALRDALNTATVAKHALDLGLAAGGVGTWEINLDTMRITASSGAHALHRLPESNRRPAPEDWLRGVHPDDAAVAREILRKAVADGTMASYTYRIFGAPDGPRWVAARGQVVATGGERRLVCALVDITDQIRVQEELRRERERLRVALEARELLVREADHRIKNSLQLVVSLLTVQLRGIEDPAAADALRDGIARVGAIAASHLALQGSENLRDIDFAITLQELCAHFARLHPAIAVVCRPQAALTLDADRAIPLGLAVSEVLTNALRHAFPDHRSGTVVVNAVQEESKLVVRVSDDGVGMPPAQRGGGLGSRIIRSLSAQLGATMQVESPPQGGTAVTFRLPLTQEQPPRRVPA
jgi:two-component sensor histidine kinase